MKRRVFALATLLGTTGCLRAVQPESKTNTESARTTELSATTTPETETEPQTSTPAPAMPRNFSQRWSKNGASGLTAFRDDTLYCTYGGVTAFAPDGSKRWNRNLAGRNHKGLYLGAERIYVPTQIGTVHAFDPETGEEPLAK